jgi:hypothetical protein
LDDLARLVADNAELKLQIEKLQKIIEGAKLSKGWRFQIHWGWAGGQNACYGYYVEDIAAESTIWVGTDLEQAFALIADMKEALPNGPRKAPGSAD